MSDNNPTYIEGVGWRYETIQRQTRRHRSHNYSAVGTYLITMTVKDRLPVFGHVDGNLSAKRGNPEYAHLVHSQLAKCILNEEIPKIHQLYPMIRIWRVVMMPDHIHMIVRVDSLLPEGTHLGHVIRGFKGGCSKVWWEMAGCSFEKTKDAEEGKDTPNDKKPPLFETGYNDRILMNDGQLERWIAYLEENPLRLLIRLRRPEIMSRALCITLNGKRYSAYGNFMLLKVPDKLQVMCHRKATIAHLTPEECERYHYNEHCDPNMKTTIPYEKTAAFQHERKTLTESAAMGTVLVTPGISKGEQIIKHDCLVNHLPLIHLQKEPITPLWKPERERFYACATGKLLILAPWPEDLEGETDYELFHNMNALAASICAMSMQATDCTYREIKGRKE